MKNRDIAPDFRRLIRKLPYSILYEMRENLVLKCRDDMPVIKMVIIEISAEMLRKQWMCGKTAI